MKQQLYLSELFIAVLCVGGMTLFLFRIYDVMEIQAFFVSLVAVALGLSLFWIYFIPRAQSQRQRTVSLIGSIIVCMSLAPWVFQPIAGSLFVERSSSWLIFSPSPSSFSKQCAIQLSDWRGDFPQISKTDANIVGEKLISDGFKVKSEGNVTWYSKRSIQIQFLEFFKHGESQGVSARIGWHARGLWFQVRAAEEEARACSDELEKWQRTHDPQSIEGK